MRGIASYIVRTVANAGEFLTVLDPENLGFSTLVAPEDPPDNAGNVAFKKWELKLKDYKENRKARTKASQSAFTILLAQCSDGLLEEMETYPGWAIIKDNMNIINLAKLIKLSWIQALRRKTLM